MNLKESEHLQAICEEIFIKSSNEIKTNRFSENDNVAPCHHDGCSGSCS